MMIKELWDLYNLILTSIEKVTRTKNIVGDYAEELVEKAYNGRCAQNSQKGYDVFTADGQRIQVKVTRQSKSKLQGSTSDFHNLDFDILVAIVFNGKGEIVKAVELTKAEAMSLTHSRNDYARSISWGKLIKNGKDVTNNIKKYQ